MKTSMKHEITALQQQLNQHGFDLFKLRGGQFGVQPKSIDDAIELLDKEIIDRILATSNAVSDAMDNTVSEDDAEEEDSERDNTPTAP